MDRIEDVDENTSDVEIESSGPSKETTSDGVAADNARFTKPLTVEENKALKRKNKKLLGRQSSKDGTLGVSSRPNFVAPERKWKNSRRPRNGVGRGLPKKGGAGGKGVWGKFGSELVEEAVDFNDPNYDDDGDFENVEFKEIVPEFNEEEFFRNLEIAILEYYEHGDTHEVAADLDDNLTRSAFPPLVIKKAIEMAMEHKNSHREMTSVLISDLYGKCLTARDFEKGFDLLLSQLPDLILDTPDAPHVLGNFLARAVADDCLPPKYVHQLSKKSAIKIDDERNGDDEGAERHLDDLAMEAVNYAEGHLTMPAGWAHLDNIWGVAGGLRPVNSITNQMEMLLKEYLLSRDIQEAERCINALEVPHFHHELVYEAVVMTLEALSENVEEAVAKLLHYLEQSCVITREMMEQGFARVYNDIQDISLDIPLAYIILERFVQRCFNLGILSEKTLKNLPSRGRKRFVSEGDYGQIKPNAMMFRDY